MSSWIIELTIVVFLVEVGSDGGGDSNEVLEEDGVADVGVKVILEMLEHVHVLLDESVSSNSWEREGSVIEFPGVDLEFWGETLLLLEGLSKVLNVGPVSQVEGSGEHINLVLEFVDGLIKVDAVVLELNEVLKIVRRLGLESELVSLSGLELDERLLLASLSGTSEKKGDGEVFHL